MCLKWFVQMRKTLPSLAILLSSQWGECLLLHADPLWMVPTATAGEGGHRAGQQHSNHVHLWDTVLDGQQVRTRGANQTTKFLCGHPLYSWSRPPRACRAAWGIQCIREEGVCSSGHWKRPVRTHPNYYWSTNSRVQQYITSRLLKMNNFIVQCVCLYVCQCYILCSEKYKTCCICRTIIHSDF